VILIYSGFFTLLVLTPFYHPYARLWLPMHAFECVFLGGAIGTGHSLIEAIARGAQKKAVSTPARPAWLALGIYYIVSVAFSIHAVAFFHPWNSELPGLLAPTDSLKIACASIARDPPANIKTVRVFARPPVNFYLGRSMHFAIERQASPSELLRPGVPATAALFDTALIKQDPALEAELDKASAQWVVERAVPSWLSLPALLDIDPMVASGGKVRTDVELRLMRPKRAGD
jgi:hypothetical protein